MVELSIVVPVYNSEGCLCELCRQVAESLEGRGWELILVDDQSSDGSWQAIRQLCGRDARVRGLRLRKNAGQDGAILCGLRASRGALVAIMDDDLQHAPSDIPRLAEACEAQSWDVCYARFSQRRHALWKRAGSWLNGKLAEIVISKPRHIYLSPFKVVRRDVVAEVVKYTGAFPYVDGLLLNITHNIGQIEVEHRPRFAGESGYSLAKSVLVFMRVATGFSVWPLRFSSWTGLLLALSGFGLGLFYLVQYLRWEHHVEGWMTIVTLLLLIGGCLLLSVGLVGEYLGRLYLNGSGKPQATVKEELNGSRPE